ncbi:MULTISPECIES: hypothetical protein [unclassified Ensifer]|uniref:hypothetical protein n=1 Tax=unclassified Ensifer TaxID=2633371 RepID=UPI000813A9EC|nr:MULTISPECIES: hypothetical protein [unclassified Ensifer]OCP02461.1 hypothetical protein BC362_19625 [Ensifer sp. LC14]OCP05289.1 hypothetical protein BC374_25065 [Ensifer sp. LC13]OCP14731.1 hypothetical protein BBX50_00010 [Ensifer sp. LC11]OCP30581.1 hypothetical protein BC364_25080 [Ensifer sp. LC499]
MTTISPTTNAVLQILRRTVESDQEPGAANSTDGLIKAANGISTEPGRATTQAADAINNTLLDMKARADGYVGMALEFVNSDRFKSSDPDAKETLKALLNENGDIFAARIEAELQNKPGLKLEEAIATALTATVRSNRSRFAETEIVLGYDLKHQANQIHYIADADGHSSGGYLAQAAGEASEGLMEARKWHMNAKDGELQDATAAVEAADRRYRNVYSLLQDWNTMWAKKFGWKDEPAEAR